MSLKNGKLEAALGALLIVPWHVSILLGEAVMVTCKWILPAMCSKNAFLVPIAELAYLVSSVLCLSGAANFVARKRWEKYAAARTSSSPPASSQVI